MVDRSEAMELTAQALSMMAHGIRYAMSAVDVPPPEALDDHTLTDEQEAALMSIVCLRTALTTLTHAVWALDPDRAHPELREGGPVHTVLTELAGDDIDPYASGAPKAAMLFMASLIRALADQDRGPLAKRR